MNTQTAKIIQFPVPAKELPDCVLKRISELPVNNIVKLYVEIRLLKAG